MFKGLILWGLVFSFFLMGLIIQRGEPFVLMLLPFLFIGMSLICKPSRVKLDVTRTIKAGRPLHGDTVTVGLHVKNTGSTIEEVMLEDLLPERFELVKGDNRLMTSLEQGESVEWEYTLRVFRGRHIFQGVQTGIGSHTGLFETQFMINAKSEVTVLPKPINLKKVVIRPRRTQVYTGSIPVRAGGVGIDFYGIREYMPGDSPRLINWKTAARHPDLLHTNEFEQERMANIVLIFDCRKQSFCIENKAVLLDYMASAAAGMANTLMNEGNRVSLLVYGGIPNYTFFGSGKVHKERILQTISKIELSAGNIFETLERIPSRLFPMYSQLIFFSPLQKNDLAPLLRLQARGYSLIIISPNPKSIENNRDQSASDAGTAERILYLERELIIRRLKKTGLRLIDWDVNIPFQQIVYRYLNRQPMITLKHNKI